MKNKGGHSMKSVHKMWYNIYEGDMGQLPPNLFGGLRWRQQGNG